MTVFIVRSAQDLLPTRRLSLPPSSARVSNHFLLAEADLPIVFSSLGRSNLPGAHRNEIRRKKEVQSGSQRRRKQRQVLVVAIPPAEKFG